MAAEPTGEQARPNRVTLHDEIVAVLRASTRRWLSTGEIAREIQRRGLYETESGNGAVTALQVHNRAKDQLRLFKRSGSRVSLRTGHS